jgi:hypothetical protein
MGITQVQLLKYEYPDRIYLLIRGKIYRYETSEYWARRVMSQLRYGEGWRALRILEKNGRRMDDGAGLETICG